MHKEVRYYLAKIGKEGGKNGKGKPKNRTKAQSSAAAKLGWETRRKNKLK